MKTKNFSKMVALVACIGVGVAVESSNAQMTLEPNGPKISQPIQEFFMGQTVYTRDQGETEISLGGSHRRDGDLRLTTLTGRAEYGVTDKLQLQAEFPMSMVDHPGGSLVTTTGDNLQVGAMYSLLPGGTDPIALSAAMDVQFPTGSSFSPNYQNTVVYKPNLIVARDFGPTQIHANAQAEIPGNGASSALNYNVGAVLPLGVVAPTLELNGRSINTSTNEIYATPGLYYRASDRAEFGVGVPIPVSDQARTLGTQVMAKFNVRF